MSSPKPQPQQVNSSSSSAPWAEQQPHLKFGFEEARKLYDDPTRLDFFPGQTFAGPDVATLKGLDTAEARATAGSPVMRGAESEAEKILSGQYLDAGNPHFAQMAGRVKANVLPGIDSRFMMGNRTGSGLHGRAVGEGLGDAIGALAHGDYRAERGMMGSTMAGAPQLAAAGYMDADTLGKVGAAREAIAQKPITEQIARHEFDQLSPYDELARYMASVTGNYGGTTTGTTTQYLQQANPWMQALGLGLSAAGAAGSIFGSDERLKEDIKPIGKTDEGTNIYAFRYKSERGPDGKMGPRRIGLMAQELLHTKPEAVGLHPSGYLVVDYDRAA